MRNLDIPYRCSLLFSCLAVFCSSGQTERTRSCHRKQAGSEIARIDRAVLPASWPEIDFYVLKPSARSSLSGSEIETGDVKENWRSETERIDTIQDSAMAGNRCPVVLHSAIAFDR